MIYYLPVSAWRPLRPDQFEALRFPKWPESFLLSDSEPDPLLDQLGRLSGGARRLQLLTAPAGLPIQTIRGRNWLTQQRIDCAV